VRYSSTQPIGTPSSNSTSKSEPNDNSFVSRVKAAVAERPTEKSTARREKATLSSSSIFEDEKPSKLQEREPLETQEPRDIIPASEREQAFDQKYGKYKLEDRVAHRLLNVVDPLPLERANWERDQIINYVRNDWKISKELHLKRTERAMTFKSLDFKTSRKKLGKLARQIAGKTVDEALLQMRYSKKRVASEVVKHLEHARDLAVVKWGMGLGKAENRTGDKIHINLKDGSKKLVEDRTEIYIDQAWVGRGPYLKEPEFRARGRVNILKKPYTSVSVLLKEEATRVREHQEKEVKKKNGKLWLHLPDRPLVGQRQYVMW